jgi:hypothetical protein
MPELYPPAKNQYYGFTTNETGFVANDSADYRLGPPLPTFMSRRVIGPLYRFGVMLTCLALLSNAACAQHTAATLPTDKMLSEPGPTFVVKDEQLPETVTLILYGDQRFTDPENKTATNPAIRQLLVRQIAQEKPAAVILNGDVPLAGNVKNDYAVFAAETRPWRDAKLRVMPALGNHEFHGDAQECLENWWSAFPELRNRRWYSTQLGSRIYVIALDTDAALTAGTDQANWLAKQIGSLPPSIDFVILTMHHPPVADIQTRHEVGHNPRPNEIRLREYLASTAKQTHARFLVSAGHIHNYERHLTEGVVYLVSGGGGAKPYEVDRTPDDLFQSGAFPNYHYVKLILQGPRLNGTMYRVANPESDKPSFEAKDSFNIDVKGR